MARGRGRSFPLDPGGYGQGLAYRARAGPRGADGDPGDAGRSDTVGAMSGSSFLWKVQPNMRLARVNASRGNPEPGYRGFALPKMRTRA
jgi:hypothetical protein